MQTTNCGSVVRRLFSVAVLALVALTGPVLAQKADRPNVKVGDRWRFEVRLGIGPSAVKTNGLARVITSVTPAGIERMDNDRKVVLTPDLNAIDTPYVKHSDLRLLSFPIEAGKQWRFTDDYLIKAFSAEGRENWSVAVVGYEKVRVPAGEFDAFKLEAKGNWMTGSKTGTDTWTYWYAPAARAVVKSEVQDTSGFTATELAEFQLQP